MKLRHQSPRPTKTKSANTTASAAHTTKASRPSTLYDSCSTINTPPFRRRRAPSRTRRTRTSTPPRSGPRTWPYSCGEKVVELRERRVSASDENVPTSRSPERASFQHRLARVLDGLKRHPVSDHAACRQRDDRGNRRVVGSGSHWRTGKFTPLMPAAYAAATCGSPTRPSH